MEKVRIFMRKAINLIKRPQMRVLPGQLAFFFVLSFIPLIAIVANVLSYFGISLLSIKSILASLPGETAETVLNAVSGTGLNLNVVVVFITAFILASNGAHSIIITSNEIYNVKDTGILKRRFKAILMTALLVAVLFFLLVVPVFGKAIFTAIKSSANNEDMITLLYNLYTIFKYPVSVIFIYFIVKIIYTIAPDQKIDSHTTTAGSIFTAISWAIATSIYSFYVTKFVNYNLLYGSISNIIILFVWVYILAYIFVLGMIINASNTNDLDLKTQVLKAFKE